MTSNPAESTDQLSVSVRVEIITCICRSYLVCATWPRVRMFGDRALQSLKNSIARLTHDGQIYCQNVPWDNVFDCVR